MAATISRSKVVNAECHRLRRGPLPVKLQRIPRELPDDLKALGADGVAHLLANIASSVKLVTGVANNAALLIMLDAHDQVKQHPRYRHEVKRAYKQAIEAWHDYEAQLLHARQNRFFHVDDMTPATRKIYGANCTDADYFEFWRSIGGPVYNNTRPLVTSLVHKYRLSMEKHGVKHAQLLAWCHTAMVAMHIAHRAYHAVIEDAIANSPCPRWLVESIFKDFDLAPVCKAWDKAVQMTDDTHYVLDKSEARNIELGMLSLAEAWADPDAMYNSTIEVTPAFEEIFRTKGEMKKALRNLADVRDACEL